MNVQDTEKDNLCISKDNLCTKMDVQDTEKDNLCISKDKKLCTKMDNDDTGKDNIFTSKDKLCTKMDDDDIGKVTLCISRDKLCPNMNDDTGKVTLLNLFIIKDNKQFTNSDSVSNVKQSDSKKTKLTRRQWLFMSVFGVSNLVNAACISLQAPFYPQQAELQGVTATEYGFVFGIFELTSFISSPIFGKYLPSLGPRLVYNTGIFVMAGSGMLFGACLLCCNSHCMAVEREEEEVQTLQTAER